MLGPERFDFAFRTYVRRWAFKSPQPADFFRTMEDAAGMDLAWFWRGWFLEDAMLDQGIENVRQPSGRRGARITFVNHERMVMPLTFRVTFADDSEQSYRLPSRSGSARTASCALSTPSKRSRGAARP